MYASKKNRKIMIFVFVLLALSFVITSCAGTPDTVEVTRVVKETELVNQTQIVKETEIVKETQIVKETEIVKETQIVKLVYGDLPRNETLILAGTASNDIWDTFTFLSGPLANAYSGFIQVGYEPAFLLAAGEYIPMLGESWEYNADGTGMTLTIKTIATWNDGQPVTLDDWVFTLEYLKENADKGVPYGTLLNNASYTTEGDNKIIFSFWKPLAADAAADAEREPAVNWRFHATIAGFAPLAKHIWEGQDPLEFKNNPPVEAGPYTLKSCNADTKTCIWERRDDYWNPDMKIAPKYIVFTRQPEPDLLTQEMIAGNFDVSQLNMRIANAAVIPENPMISAIEWPDPCPRHLFFNADVVPLNDPMFRRAIGLLIDRGRAGNLDNPPAVPVVAPFPYQGTPPEKFVDPADTAAYDVGVFDPEKAAQMLDDAGYVLVDGKRVDLEGNPISLDVMTFDPSIHGAAVNGFAQMLSEEAAKIGLEINVKVAEVGVFFDTTSTGDYDMTYGWVCGNPVDPIASYSFLHSRDYKPIGEATGYGPHLRYQNPELDALVDQIEQGDPASDATAAAYRALYKIVAEDAPYVPLFALYQGFPWNNEYWTGITNQTEPWYWQSSFRNMLNFIDSVQ